MSINTENLCVKSFDQSKVLCLIESVWRTNAFLAKPDWTLPCSFDEPSQTKRALAVSPSMDGWVIIVESVGFVDFGLARTLSVQLETEFLITQIAETTGFAAYLYGLCGNEIKSYFSEDDIDPLGTVRDALKTYGIPLKRPLIYLDCLKNKKEGWQLIRKDK